MRSAASPATLPSAPSVSSSDSDAGSGTGSRSGGSSSPVARNATKPSSTATASRPSSTVGGENSSSLPPPLPAWPPADGPDGSSGMRPLSVGESVPKSPQALTSNHAGNSTVDVTNTTMTAGTMPSRRYATKPSNSANPRSAKPTPGDASAGTQAGWRASGPVPSAGVGLSSPSPPSPDCVAVPLGSEPPSPNPVPPAGCWGFASVAAANDTATTQRRATTRARRLRSTGGVYEVRSIGLANSSLDSPVFGVNRESLNLVTNQ